MTDRPVLLEDEPFTTHPAMDDHDGMNKAMEMKQNSHNFDQLESLKVSDDQLVGKLTYNQLSLYEKKSVLVSTHSTLPRWAIELIVALLLSD